MIGRMDANREEVGEEEAYRVLGYCLDIRCSD
jgi:hypothetical protein